MSAQTVTLWQATARMPTFPPLQADVAADVCVVGAGIAGLTAAYMLTRAGRRVVVLEARALGDGNTGRTTAHLASAIDDRFQEVVRIHGREHASLAWRAHAAAIDAIADIVAAESIDCAFERLDGYLFLAPGHTIEHLDDELAACRDIGFDTVERAAYAPLGGFDTGPALRFPGQAQFHPLDYLAGLATAVARAGGQIFTNTRAARIVGGAEPRVETTDGRTVRAAAVIQATNVPVHDNQGVHPRQAPYMTYAIALRIPAGAVPRGLYWDTADPYHYIRLHPSADGEFLIVGGEDHKAGQAADGERRLADLEAWTRERFPAAGAVVHRWSGMVLETIDGLGLIGRTPGEANLYVATGDSGMGMTHGTIAGTLLRDLILGVDNPLRPVFDPARAPLRAARDALRENLNVAAQYADWVGPGEVASVAEIPPGGGAVVRRGLTKLAVHRDLEGRLHACSAACTHLKGPVAWNPVESTWDCTCHGSRFDARGRVINGPANTDLTPVALDDA
jgi:glycine/D-amino acid oxidase-like deaminating enzyme/nitrite reductase/ring-hydroxylating ferredoxin subunit